MLNINKSQSLLFFSQSNKSVLNKSKIPLYNKPQVFKDKKMEDLLDFMQRPAPTPKPIASPSPEPEQEKEFTVSEISAEIKRFVETKFNHVRIKGEKILVNLTSLGPLFVWRKVMTIHDLAFMVNPKWYSRSYLLLYKFMTPLCAKTSLHIITVSNFSKNEIINRLFINRKKISVIYNAVSNFFLDNSTDTHGLIEEKYILAVSSIDPRKNFSILLKAFDRIKDANVKLYIIGGQNSIYSTTIAELSRVCVSERIKWLGRVSDTELKIFYSNALCFVYPSLYEGFGIPPLEAMASGTPTIVSNIPPLKEVCADASLYVNPKDEFDIADKINLLVSNPTLRRHLIMKGFERCQYFNWHRSAESLFHKIDRLLRENM